MGTRVPISDNFWAQFDSRDLGQEKHSGPMLQSWGSDLRSQTMEVQAGRYHQGEFSCRRRAGRDGTSPFSEPHSLAKGAGIFPQDKSQQKVSRQAALVMTCWE